MAHRTGTAEKATDGTARGRIVAAALEVFAERGFEGASVQAIAERAGVSKGLPYHYFESKEELLAAALRSHLDGLLQATEGIRRQDDPAQGLEALIDGLIEHVAGRPDAFRLYAALSLRTPADTLRAALETAEEPLQEYLGRIHGLFVELGSPDPEVDAVLFRSALLGVCIRLSSGEVDLPVGALRARLVDFFVRTSPTNRRPS